MTTFLPQNQFITNSVAQPPNSVAADTAAAPPQPPVAAAGPIPASTGGPQRAPAGRAPNTATPVGALESRLLRALLFELDEVPLFIRDGLHLRRWNA